MGNNNQCLKVNRVEDGSAYLTARKFNYIEAEKETTLEDGTVMPKINDDGITRLTPDLTTFQQAPTLPGNEPTTTTTTTVFPEKPSDPIPFSDPYVEIDFYNSGCKAIESVIDYIKNTLPVIKGGTIVEYYKTKLQQAEAAYSSLKCDVPDVVDISNPATVKDPEASPAPSPAPAPEHIQDTEKQPEPEKQQETTTTSTSTTAILPGAVPSGAAGGAGAGGGGGGGGGNGQKKPGSSKFNWWLLAACVATYGFSIYMGRNKPL